MNNADIWQCVERFRTRHTPDLNADKVPLDLLTFIELELKLDVIPLDGLANDFSADAAILSDFTGIYIDGETYDRLDTLPQWRENRLRFTLAHELGHLILHRELFESQAINSKDSLREWLNNHGGEKYRIEKEANEFGGSLLVPIAELTTSFNKLANALDQLRGTHGWQNDDQLRAKTCEQIAPRFGVNAQVIEVRLDRSQLWPSIY